MSRTFCPSPVCGNCWPLAIWRISRKNQPLWLSGTPVLTELVGDLLEGEGDASLRGALLASELSTDGAFNRPLTEKMQKIVETGA